MSEEQNPPQHCLECKHDEWICAWQAKERRKDEIFKAVQTNVITWVTIGVASYVLMLIFESFKTHVVK